MFLVLARSSSLSPMERNHILKVEALHNEKSCMCVRSFTLESVSKSFSVDDTLPFEFCVASQIYFSVALKSKES